MMVQAWLVFREAVIIILIMIPFALIWGYCLFKKRYTHYGSKKESIVTVIRDVLLILSIIGILLVTIYPFRWGVPSTLQLIPIVSSYDVLINSAHISTPIRILGFNIVLFIPFGFFLGWKLSYHKNPQIKTILFGALLSSFVEVTQFLLPLDRTANIDDIILNTVGTFIGVYALIKLQKKFPNVFKTFNA
ncbi:glycopeptide antibiotics resistance protein [Natranaerovirga hydrolytica]|uniref:Glycopeptide antibiotics resistance protein n=1 Tax=Natranaerovirga hydrolytica TaxID=680378 RepID=A0A4R1MY26_9FIRM|nr:VanZ family protein [Natranaerovirga hydrolytica]TCK98177.1 glycopeptide antibiotics resistance protein [Natranaerovirga hydrolytica]